MSRRLLDPRFKYVPSSNTDVGATLRKHGFRPMTDAERAARQKAFHDGKLPQSATVTQLQPGKRKVSVPALRLTVKGSK